MTSEFGTFRLTYTPSEVRSPDYPSITVDMSMDGEADINDMLRFFEAFLQASGYVLKGELQISEPEKEKERNLETFTTFNFTGDPYIYGGESEDTIFFGAAQPVGSCFSTHSDIISFG